MQVLGGDLAGQQRAAAGVAVVENLEEVVPSLGGAGAVEELFDERCRVRSGPLAPGDQPGRSPTRVRAVRGSRKRPLCTIRGRESSVWVEARSSRPGGTG